MEDKKELKIVCPFCNAPYTADMKDNLYSSEGYGCDTCGGGGSVEGTFEIVCTNCKKVVYKKEY